MTDQDYLDLFEKCDGEGCYEPAGFDEAHALEKLGRFKADLDRSLPVPSEDIRQDQDVSYFGRIFLPASLTTNGYGCHIVASAFGNMMSVEGEADVLPPWLDLIKAIAENHGFLYVPERLLFQRCQPGEDYEWWRRFFDYV